MNALHTIGRRYLVTVPALSRDVYIYRLGVFKSCEELDGRLSRPADRAAAIDQERTQKPRRNNRDDPPDWRPSRQ